jgi:stage V sporulation protein S
MTTAILKVSAKTNPKSAAGAIASVVRDGSDKIEVTVIGAASLNQLVKAVAIARGYVTPTGKDLALVPSFTEVDVAGQERTALFLVIEVQKG